MSTSENNKRLIIIYMAVTLFCIIFTIAYYRFSHGVKSDYLTWLWAVPFAAGIIPSIISLFFPLLKKGSFAGCYLYNAGVAAITVHVALKGIFEIAGTDSDYEKWIFAAGIVMVVAGVIVINVSAIIKTLSGNKK